jgi:phospholipase/lecithinase/hemolysin
MTSTRGRRLPALATSASAVALLALAASPVEADTYAVFNPYVATQSTFNQIKVRRLVAFGDSYTDPSHQGNGGGGTLVPYRHWAQHLKADGGVQIFTPEAKAGATATSAATNGVVNSFKMQVDSWLARNINYAVGDLTVVYFGQNDINRLDNLTRSRNDYQAQLNRLVNDGALGSNRRMLLTLVHDIARNPNHQARAENNTTVWNQHVVEIANTRPRFIAVDLHTAFNRVFENPQRFGFTNVTTADPSRHTIDALYVDGQHFGERGQLLIGQVFKHYLTRGWDWANTIKAGSETIARLNADIDAGRVFQTFDLADQSGAGLALLPFGALAQGPGLAEEPVWARDGGAAFSEQPVDQAADGGLALRYSLGGGTDIALLASEYGATSDMGTEAGSESSSAKSRATGLVIGHRTGNVQLSTSLIYSDDSYRRSAFDSFVGQSESARFGGETMRLGQRVGYVVEAEHATITPWAELSWQRQEIDSYTISNPFVSDQTYSAEPVEQTTASLGVAAEALPIRVGAHGDLRLFGGLAYNHGLTSDDYKVTITEAATGFRQRETIEREPGRTLSLNLGASYEPQPGIALTAGYAALTPIVSGSDDEPAHQLGARVSFRF